MALSSADRLIYQQRLVEARDALHRISIGQSLVEVRDQNGELVRYSPASAQKLRMYISELEFLLNGAASSQPFKVWLR